MLRVFVLRMLLAAAAVTVGQTAFGQVNPFNPSASIARNAVFSRPTVSPYLELLSPSGGQSPYFTRVRPQLQQQAINRAASVNFQQLQRQISQASQATRTQPQGREVIRATGHPTQFFFYSSYYPTLNRR